MDKRFNKVFPVPFFMLAWCPKHLEKSVADSLNWISSGMVWSGMHFLYANELTEVLDGL